MMGIAKTLIIEGDGMVALDIQRCLHGLGHSAPEVVPTGEDAVRSVLERSPSLVLSEVSLKGEMSGIEAVETIRSHVDVPIVYMTAVSEQLPTDVLEIPKHHGFLLKPFTVGQLQKAVEVAVRKWRNEAIPRMERIEQWAMSTIAVEQYATIIDRQSQRGDSSEKARIESGETARCSYTVETERFIVPSVCVDSVTHDAVGALSFTERRPPPQKHSEMRIRCMGLDEVRFTADGSPYRVPRFSIRTERENSSADEGREEAMTESVNTRRLLEILTEEIERLAVQGEDLSGILELAIGITEGRYPRRERERIVVDLVTKVGYFPQYDRMSLQELQEFREHLQGSS